MRATGHRRTTNIILGGRRKSKISEWGLQDATYAPRNAHLSTPRFSLVPFSLPLPLCRIFRKTSGLSKRSVSPVLGAGALSCTSSPTHGTRTPLIPDPRSGSPTQAWPWETRQLAPDFAASGAVGDGCAAACPRPACSARTCPAPAPADPRAAALWRLAASPQLASHDSRPSPVFACSRSPMNASGLDPCPNI